MLIWFHQPVLDSLKYPYNPSVTFKVKKNSQDFSFMAGCMQWYAKSQNVRKTSCLITIHSQQRGRSTLRRSVKCNEKIQKERRPKETLMASLCLYALIIFPHPLTLSWMKEMWFKKKKKKRWSIMNCELPLSGAVGLQAVDKTELWQPYSAPSSIINHREGEHFHT